MVRFFLMVLCGALVAVFAAASASAQVFCGEHEQIARQLETQFAEKRRGLGLASNGAVLELYAAADGNWTVLMTFPDGRACLVAEGESWATVPAVVGGPEV